jgi:3-hydroxyacyl-[acyl-carrier-protein] dehydratase
LIDDRTLPSTAEALAADAHGTIMPPQLLFDIGGIDLSRVIHDQEAIRGYNPQRGDMEHLNGIIHIAPDRILGYKDVRGDEFWVPGHIPGRPLFPGVLMIEAGAQLAGFYTRCEVGWKGFIGFGGVDDVKFRTQVVPPCRMYLLGLKIWERHHRINCRIQGLVDGTVCFEASITGTEM